MTADTYQLSGMIAPGITFVLGDTSSDSATYSPAVNQSQDFSTDIQNSGSVGDGVALFEGPAMGITSSKVPIDAVVYGSNNNDILIDETGSANAPDVGDSSAGSSIERTTIGGSWQIQSPPTPNSTSL